MQTTQFLYEQGLHLIAVCLRHLPHGLRNDTQCLDMGVLNHLADGVFDQFPIG